MPNCCFELFFLNRLYKQEVRCYQVSFTCSFSLYAKLTGGWLYLYNHRTDVSDMDPTLSTTANTRVS